MEESEKLTCSAVKSGVPSSLCRGMKPADLDVVQSDFTKKFVALTYNRRQSLSSYYMTLSIYYEKCFMRD